MNRDTTKLRIIQYNVNRSYDVMAHLLRLPQAQQMDIIAIQEPWVNPHNRSTHNPVKNAFHTVLPDTEERPRVCFYIHRGIDIRKVRVQQYKSRDMLSVLLETETPVAIHNIYNPHTDGSPSNMEYNRIPGNSVIPMLDRALRTYNIREQIVIGDFNLHHPDWAGQGARESHANQTTCLKEVFSKGGMKQCLPVGMITRRSDQQGVTDSTIDLVWATEGVKQALHSCGTRLDLDCDSDHLPVETVVNMTTPQEPDKLRRNYAAMDAQKLRSEVERRLDTQTLLRTQEQLDNAAAKIASVLMEAATAATPQVRIHSTYTRQEFSQEVAEKIGNARRARRRWQAQRDPLDRKEYKEALRQKARAITRSNRDDHRDRVAQVNSPKALWKLARWVNNRHESRSVFTPDITY